MKTLPQLSARMRLILTMVSIATLSGCTSSMTSSYTLSYETPDGKQIEKSYDVVTTEYRGFVSSSTYYESDGLTANQALPPPPPTPGATISIEGTITIADGSFGTNLSLSTITCAVAEGGPCFAEGKALENATTESAKSLASNRILECIKSKGESCEKKARDRSYSITCPQSCPTGQIPSLVPNSTLMLGCVCQTPSPPSCADTQALNEMNANGEPAWSTCTPVELPILKTNQMNDALLKQMMGGNGCMLVYSLALHQYVCQ